MYVRKTFDLQLLLFLDAIEHSLGSPGLSALRGDFDHSKASRSKSRGDPNIFLNTYLRTRTLAAEKRPYNVAKQGVQCPVLDVL